MTICKLLLDTGLAAGDRERGAAARGVEGLHAIAGQLFGPDQGGLLHHPHLLPLHPGGVEDYLE